jgi:hypothetical protein
LLLQGTAYTQQQPAAFEGQCVFGSALDSDCGLVVADSTSRKESEKISQLSMLKGPLLLSAASPPPYKKAKII